MNFTLDNMKLFMLGIYLILANCCSVFCQTDMSERCPSPEAISPCTCSESYGVTVSCVDMVNKEQLMEIANKSTDWSFPTLSVTNSTLMHLPTDVIIKKKVGTLKVRHCVMTTFFEEAIPPNITLKKIFLHNLVLTRGIKWEEFSKLANLEVFVLNVCDIERIDQSFVANIPRGLVQFQMGDTKTKSLHDYAFSKLSELNYLYMIENEITIIKRSMFPPQSKIIEMSFRLSKISYLPDDIFTNMPMLEVVSFDNTNIAVLQESVFKSVLPQLRQLNLRGNEMDCSCEMKWLVGVPKPPYNTVVCQKPTALKGIGVPELTSDHFAHCGAIVHSKLSEPLFYLNMLFILAFLRYIR